MKEFTSSFVAIPLPEEFRKDYVEVLDEVGLRFPEIKLMSGAEPHITVVYLKKSSLSVPEVAVEIRRRLGMIRGRSITVGGFDYFRPGNPRVLFLRVEYPVELEDYKTRVSAMLSEYTALENDFRFHPHLTVGSIANWPDFDIDVVNTKMCRFKWTFPIGQLGIYGADSTQRPEYQELLEVVR